MPIELELFLPGSPLTFARCGRHSTGARLPVPTGPLGEGDDVEPDGRRSGNWHQLDGKLRHAASRGRQRFILCRQVQPILRRGQDHAGPGHLLCSTQADSCRRGPEVAQPHAKVGSLTTVNCFSSNSARQKSCSSLCARTPAKALLQHLLSLSCPSPSMNLDASNILAFTDLVKAIKVVMRECSALLVFVVSL